MIKKKLDLPHKMAERNEDEVARASCPWFDSWPGRPGYSAGKMPAVPGEGGTGILARE